MTEQPTVSRSRGSTPSEERLARLCERAFLRLWSYPSVYRNQVDGSGATQGKEVADLLVVFDDDILIFSDKDCAFPNTGNLRLDWSRWYRRAILRSAERSPRQSSSLRRRHS